MAYTKNPAVLWNVDQDLTSEQKQKARSNIGLGNVDNTSDATKKTNFTGAIADGNEGFVTGDAVYDALALKAPLASPEFTGTPTAPTASAGTDTTQVATTAFVKSEINSVLDSADVMQLKGTIGVAADNPSVTALPNEHKAGWAYKVVTAGTYAGKACEVGDMIICVKDGTVAADADWTVMQGNLNGVVIGPSSSTDGHVALFANSTGKLIKDGGALGTAAFKDVPISGNASTTQVVMGDDSRLSDTRPPQSHAHGQIHNDGTIGDHDIVIGNGDHLIVADSSHSDLVSMTALSFDGNTTNKALTPKGTWESFEKPLPTTGTATDTYAINISGNAATSTTADNLKKLSLGSVNTLPLADMCSDKFKAGTFYLKKTSDGGSAYVFGNVTIPNDQRYRFTTSGGESASDRFCSITLEPCDGGSNISFATYKILMNGNTTTPSQVVRIPYESTTAAVGGTTTPVYVDSDGQIKSCEAVDKLKDFNGTRAITAGWAGNDISAVSSSATGVYESDINWSSGTGPTTPYLIAGVNDNGTIRYKGVHCSNVKVGYSDNATTAATASDAATGSNLADAIKPDADVAVVTVEETNFTGATQLFSRGYKLELHVGANVPGGHGEILKYHVPLSFVIYDSSNNVIRFVFEQQGDDVINASNTGALMQWNLSAANGWTSSVKSVAYATNAGTAGQANAATNATNDAGGANIRDTYVYVVDGPAAPVNAVPQTRVRAVKSVTSTVDGNGFKVCSLNTEQINISPIWYKYLYHMGAYKADGTTTLPTYGGESYAYVSRNDSQYGYDGFVTLGNEDSTHLGFADSADDVSLLSGGYFEIDFDVVIHCLSQANPTPTAVTDPPPSVLNVVFALADVNGTFSTRCAHFEYRDETVVSQSFVSIPCNLANEAYAHVRLCGALTGGFNNRLVLGAQHNNAASIILAIKVENMHGKWIHNTFSHA